MLHYGVRPMRVGKVPLTTAAIGRFRPTVPHLILPPGSSRRRDHAFAVSSASARFPECRILFRCPRMSSATVICVLVETM